MTHVPALTTTTTLDRLWDEIDECNAIIEDALNAGDESAAAAYVVKAAHLDEMVDELIDDLKYDDYDPSLDSMFLNHEVGR